jgi:hypothetical protein
MKFEQNSGSLFVRETRTNICHMSCELFMTSSGEFLPAVLAGVVIAIRIVWDFGASLEMGEDDRIGTSTHLEED